jgi:hypothetical protein
LHFQVTVDDLEVLLGFVVQVFLELMALVAVMDRLDSLFKADGDEEAEDDGGDVDEEVAPGAGGVVGGVDVEHGGHSKAESRKDKKVDWWVVCLMHTVSCYGL